MSSIEILSIASEIYPLVKTGGLADVVGALPGALAAEAVSVRTLIPGYPSVIEALDPAETLHDFADLFGGPARLLAGRAQELELFVLDAPHLFRRPGNPYTGADGRDWPDNGLRFAALAGVGASLGGRLVPGYSPAVIHAHDWQAGLTPAYLHYGGGRGPGTVMTIHNLAYQGWFPPDLLPALGLPPSSFSIEGVEYYGGVGYLKAGLRFADRITTVSPTYADEIRTPAAGMGLDGLLRTRADVLSGIVNGIDVDVWNPATDPSIAARFDKTCLAKRGRNKEALQSRLGLTADPDALLFGVISRLTWHKGLDLLLSTLPSLSAEGAQLAVVGMGEAGIESGFRAAAEANPGRIGCVIGYDEGLAHLIQAGADALLVPSRSEPCGLTQLCALRYGNVPVVARVGGLADTVEDADPTTLAMGKGTGVQFSPVTADALESAIRRTAALHREPDSWRRLQLNAMERDVSWRSPARRYAALYRELAARAA
ncbi:MAG: starch synthase [Rhodospirillaceae bacterium]|jgi:starch synthase|nr:starch synthase [Rhodospirillaceae bacterium]